MKRLKHVFTALIVAAGVTHAGAVEYKAMTIRAATANPDGSLHTTAINKFKEVVEAESAGKIKVQTFYGGSMGDEQANVRQLRTQEIHLAVLAVGNLTPFAAQANIFYLPYMFPEIGSAYKLLGNEAFTGKIGDKVAAQSGARPLAWLIGGYRHITNSKRPITKIDDLKGLKIRVPPVAVQLEFLQGMGHRTTSARMVGDLQRPAAGRHRRTGEPAYGQPRPEILGSPEAHHRASLHALDRPDAGQRQLVQGAGR